MKKIFLPLGLLALIAAPSAGSAKLVLDIPPILAGLCNKTCTACDLDCANPCVSCCSTGDVCNPCSVSYSKEDCGNGTPCKTCCDNYDPAAGGCNPCDEDGGFDETKCTNSCITSAAQCCDSKCDACNPALCAGNNPCATNVCVRFNDTGITAPTGGGQDADFGRDKTHPDDTDGWKGFSFTKTSSGGCITDNVTRLTWSPDLGTSNWDGTTGVVTENSSLCGKTEWRLPTLRELLSIVSYHKTAPAIDNDATRGFFSDTQSASYWTSNSVSSATTQWGVNFLTGGTALLDKSSLNFSTRVRLVTSSN